MALILLNHHNKQQQSTKSMRCFPFLQEGFDLTVKACPALGSTSSWSVALPGSSGRKETIHKGCHQFETKSVLPLGGVAPLISEQESSSIWSALPGEADPALLRCRPVVSGSLILAA